MHSSNTVYYTTSVDRVTLALVEGDIALEPVDAVVNAANIDLYHGIGVAGAIVSRGGPTIQEESLALAPVPVGGAVVTGGGTLPARWVIHAVGPRWGMDGVDEEADRLLASAVRSALDCASEPDRKITSVSLPAISTGVFDYPHDRAARVILTTIRDWLSEHPETSLREIRFCLYGVEMVKLVDRIWAEIFPE